MHALAVRQAIAAAEYRASLALGLATTVMGAFSDDEVRRLLHLGADQIHWCMIPIASP